MNKKQFNDYILEKYDEIDIVKYFEQYKNYFKCNLNTEFMDYFLEICEQDDICCISHEKLFEFDIFKKETTKPKDIKNKLIILNMKEKKDYILLINNIEESEKDYSEINKKSYKKTYMLTPDTFKEILISSINGTIYRQYYILLEKIYKYYNIYQLTRKDNILKDSGDKINKLYALCKSQSVKIDDILHQSKTTNNKLEDTNNKLEDTNRKLKDTSSKLEDTSDKVVELTEEIEDLNDGINSMTKQLINIGDELTITNEKLDICVNHIVKPNMIPGKQQYYGIVYYPKRNSAKLIVGKINYVIKTTDNLVNNGAVLIRRNYTSNPHDLKTYVKKSIDSIKKNLQSEISNCKTYLKKTIKKLKEEMKNNLESDDAKIYGAKTRIKNNYALLINNKKIENKKKIDNLIEKLNTTPIMYNSDIKLINLDAEWLFELIEHNILEQKELPEFIDLESRDNEN